MPALAVDESPRTRFGMFQRVPSALVVSNPSILSGEHIRVLVIDDDDNAITALLRLLRAARYEAVGINESRLAVETVRKTRPDVILCDVSMPGMDGYEVLRALKRDPQTAVIPFIFLSGRGDHCDIRHGMGLGADDYLTKPFESHELFESISARIERQRLIAGKLEGLRQNLLHSVPHEFFTPLNTILGFSMVVLEGLRAGEEINARDLEDTMESINDAGDQLHRIASNYVLYAELAGRVSEDASAEAPPPTPIAETDLGRLVRKIGTQNRRMPDVHYSFAPADVRARTSTVEKIVAELLSNALKFSHAGEWVSVTGSIDGEDYLLRVVDHGPGMSVEQTRIVEALSRGSIAPSASGPGGLGLTICALLAHLECGVLSISKNPDRGTMVTVRFPLHEQD
jgi:CheY-like chemotaxis protein